MPQRGRLFAASLLVLCGCTELHHLDFLGKKPDFSILQCKRELREYIVDGANRVMFNSQDRFGVTSGVSKFRYGEILLPEDQRGEQYIISWKCRFPKGTYENLVLRFEYMYGDRKTIHIAEHAYKVFHRGVYKYVWENVGEQYVNNGHVVAWRVSLNVREKQVASLQSALWKTI